MTTADRIESVDGVLVIAGTGLPVSLIAVELIRGQTADEIQSTYLALTGADIEAVREWILARCGLLSE